MIIKKREINPSFSILSICAWLPDFVFRDAFPGECGSVPVGQQAPDALPVLFREYGIDVSR